MRIHRIAGLLIGAAALLFVAGCGGVNRVEEPEVVRLGWNFGGHVSSKRAEYEEIAATGKRVVIDGPQLSADAFLAFSVPGACYTPNGGWSPHAASWWGLFPKPGLTEELTAGLPQPLQDEFRGSWHSYDWITLSSYSSARLREIWPEGLCPMELWKYGRFANVDEQRPSPLTTQLEWDAVKQGRDL